MRLGRAAEPGRNRERDFHKDGRSDEAHASTTDPDARLYRKGNGRGSRLCVMGEAPMENDHGRVVNGALSPAAGTAEREATLTMLRRRKGRRAKTGNARKTAVDGRTTRRVGDAISRRRRKRIGETFGWIKAQAGFAKIKVRSKPKAEAVLTFAAAACNVVRIPTRPAEAAPGSEGSRLFERADRRHISKDHPNREPDQTSSAACFDGCVIPSRFCASRRPLRAMTPRSGRRPRGRCSLRP